MIPMDHRQRRIGLAGIGLAALTYIVLAVVVPLLHEHKAQEPRKRPAAIQVPEKRRPMPEAVRNEIKGKLRLVSPNQLRGIGVAEKGNG